MKSIVAFSALGALALGCSLASGPGEGLRALDRASATRTLGALQEPRPVPDPTPVWEKCSTVQADQVCEAAFGDGCSAPGDTCRYCETNPVAGYKSCKPTLIENQCDRSAGGGIVSCGLRYTGTCDDDNQCVGTTDGTGCNDSGSLKHECG